ncbi:hypothetical protein ACU4GD_32785 [Cupriavidus basilensis]
MLARLMRAGAIEAATNALEGAAQAAGFRGASGKQFPDRKLLMEGAERRR